MSAGGIIYGAGSIISSLFSPGLDKDTTALNAVYPTPNEKIVLVAPATDELNHDIILVQTTYTAPRDASDMQDVKMAAINAAEGDLRGFLQAYTKETTGKDKNFDKITRSRYCVLGTENNYDGTYTSCVAVNDWLRYRRRIEKAFGHQKYRKIQGASHRR